MNILQLASNHALTINVKQSVRYLPFHKIQSVFSQLFIVLQDSIILQPILQIHIYRADIYLREGWPLRG